MTLFEIEPLPEPEPEPVKSATARRTEQQRALLARGVHPATGQPLAVSGTCGSCVWHHAYLVGNSRTVHKCEMHRLGESHSGASDIRVGWPACTLHVLLGAEMMWTRFDHTEPPDESWPPEGVLVLLRAAGSSVRPEIASWRYDSQPDPWLVDWWDRENECHYDIPCWDEIEWSPLPQMSTPTTQRLEREVAERYGL